MASTRGTALCAESLNSQFVIFNELPSLPMTQSIMNTNPCFSGLLIMIYMLPRILVVVTVEMCFHTVFL